jgi:hypothetical protein
MRYKGSQNTTPSKPYVDYGGRNTSASVVPFDNRSIKPYPPVTIPKSADQLVNLTIGRVVSAYTWSTSGGGLYDMMANWDDPILYDINAKNNLDPKVTIQTKNEIWVDLLLQLGEMPSTPATQAPHVMHKHSNKAFILGIGPGFFQLVQYRESLHRASGTIPDREPSDERYIRHHGHKGPTWMIVRYQVVNPGPFLFHCHIETHMSNGMAVALLDGVDVWPQVPAGEEQSPGAQVKLARQGQIGGQDLPDQSGSSFMPQPNMPSPGGMPMWPPAPKAMPAGPPPMSKCLPHHEEITVIDVVEDFPQIPVEVNQRPAPPVGRAYQDLRW